MSNYSANDYRFYLAHKGKGKWTWPGGKNSKEYNANYYQTHKEKWGIKDKIAEKVGVKALYDAADKENKLRDDAYNVDVAYQDYDYHKNVTNQNAAYKKDLDTNFKDDFFKKSREDAKKELIRSVEEQDAAARRKAKAHSDVLASNHEYEKALKKYSKTPLGRIHNTKVGQKIVKKLLESRR